MPSNIKPVCSEQLSRGYDKRYVVVDTETGEILDDAQGYGFRTPQKAMACWAYKNRDKTKDKEYREKQDHIRQWLRHHKEFSRDMDEIAFEIAKGSWGPDDKFDAGLVGEMLKNSGLKPDFTPAELLRVWRRG